jgi:PKHD-type hydroxylase
MSSYQFFPLPPSKEEHETFVLWNNGFSEEELTSIEKYCDENLITSQATFFGQETLENHDNIRKSKTGWIRNNDETGWFYDKMAFIARNLNGQFYRFDLYGFIEDFQYTIYDGTEEGHYNWHIDSGHNTPNTRKLSLVLQLTDPSEYEGGELQFMTSSEAMTSKKERGCIAAFPSFRLHRVTPVTKGVRKTIVVWVAGPPFK